MDLGILIALEEEFEQLLAALPTFQSVSNPIHAGYDYTFVLPRTLGGEYRCVTTFVGNSGPEAMGIAAQQMLQNWRPAALILLGTAAAVQDDIQLGDIVVAEQVDAYLANVKAVSGGEAGWSFEHRGKVFQADHALLQEVVHLKFTQRTAFQEWQTRVAQLQTEIIPPSIRLALQEQHLLRPAPLVHSGHLASGPVQGAAVAFTHWIHRRDGSIKALETDAAGLMTTVSRQNQHVRTLVIRGISAFSDTRNSQCSSMCSSMCSAADDSDLRRYAINNVLQLFFTLTQVGAFPGALTAPDLLGTVAHVRPVDAVRSRSESQQKVTGSAEGEQSQNTILILTATPENHMPLRVDKELNLIRRLYNGGAERSRFRLEIVTATTLSDLRDALLRYRPRLVQFSGHGLGEDGLLIEHEVYGAQELGTHTLERLLRLHSDHVECVLLNACESLEQASALTSHIPTVIGMKHPLRDTAAIAFTMGFYLALFHGRSYRAAFEHGREQLRGASPCEVDTPVLFPTASLSSAGT